MFNLINFLYKKLKQFDFDDTFVTLNNAKLNLFWSLLNSFSKQFKNIFSPRIYNFGFSVIEIMIALTVISLVIAALTPIIAKKLNPAVQLGFTHVDPYYYGPPRSQDDCTRVNKALFYLEIDGTGHCVTKYNVGDSVDGVGFDIPKIAGVTVVGATENCPYARANNLPATAKCCWQGNTASDCDASEGDYSGCNRTLCNWHAANSICESLGGRLPTFDELQVIMADDLNQKGIFGLQFCNHGSGGYTICGSINDDSACKYQNAGGRCQPCLVWSSTDVEEAFAQCLNGGVNCRYVLGYVSAILGDHGQMHYTYYGHSARCIFDKVRIGTCTDPDGCWNCNTGEYYTQADDSCTECPIGYYCMYDNKTLCPTGQYADKTGQGSCTNCNVKTVHCTECNAATGECTACESGYIFSDGQCWPMPEDHGATFYIEETGKYVSKYNIGDFVDGVGLPIPPSAGVTVVNAGETCGSSGDYTSKCCWQGATANQLACDSANGSYSGCNRTVCTWAAANASCSSLGGTILSASSLANYMLNYSKGLNDQGLQFCDLNSGYGSSRCYDSAATECVGSENGVCHIDAVWADSGNENHKMSVSLTNGEISALSDFPLSRANSFRCEFDEEPVICEEGKYWDGSSCIDCPYGCSSCSHDICTGCKDDSTIPNGSWHLIGGNCTPSCDSNYVWCGLGHVCLPRPSYCANYSCKSYRNDYCYRNGSSCYVMGGGYSYAMNCSSCDGNHSLYFNNYSYATSCSVNGSGCKVSGIGWTRIYLCR